MCLAAGVASGKRRTSNEAMFWVSAKRTAGRNQMLTITPSDRLNRELRRWARGMSDTITLDWVITEEIASGNLRPGADRETIKAMALESYVV